MVMALLRGFYQSVAQAQTRFPNNAPGMLAHDANYFYFWYVIFVPYLEFDDGQVTFSDRLVQKPDFSKRFIVVTGFQLCSLDINVSINDYAFFQSFNSCSES